MVNVGAYDKRFYKQGEKRMFKCSKDLDSDVYKTSKCSYERGTSAEETIRNVCVGVKSLLDWTFEGCGGEGVGNARARATAEKMGNICRRLIKNLN